MSKRFVTLLIISLVLLSIVPFAVAQDAPDKPKIGFLPGVVDPFYQVMEIGVNEAVADFGLEVVTQYPQTWGADGADADSGSHDRARRPGLPHHRPDR